MSGIMGGGGGMVRSMVQKAKAAREGRLSMTYTGIDPRKRQGTNKGGGTRKGPGRRGRGGVGSSVKTPGPGPVKTPLSM